MPTLRDALITVAIADGYTVDANGIIRSPGKFEAEDVAILHYWDAMLDGGSDQTLYDGEYPLDVFLCTAEDRERLTGTPSMSDTIHAIILSESGQGFARMAVLDATEYRALVAGTEHEIGGDDAAI